MYVWYVHTMSLTNSQITMNTGHPKKKITALEASHSHRYVLAHRSKYDMYLWWFLVKFLCATWIEVVCISERVDVMFVVIFFYYKQNVIGILRLPWLLLQPRYSDSLYPSMCPSVSSSTCLSVCASVCRLCPSVPLLESPSLPPCRPTVGLFRLIRPPVFLSL